MVLETRLGRTFCILLGGIVMALVAYGGQMEYKGNVSLGRVEMRGATIRQATIDGLQLDYRLADAQDPAGEAERGLLPELVLYLGDSRGGIADVNEVIYRIVGPRGAELQARAVAVRGGYRADIYLSAQGRYRIATEISTSRGRIHDRFDYEIL